MLSLTHIEHLFAWLFGRSRRSQPLLTSGANVRLMSPRDLPQAWRNLALRSDQLDLLAPLTPAQAEQRLRNVMQSLTARSVNVRVGYFAEAAASHDKGLPTFPIGVIRVGDSLPKNVREHIVVPHYRINRDKNGWMWITMILAARRAAEDKPVRAEQEPVTGETLRIERPVTTHQAPRPEPVTDTAPPALESVPVQEQQPIEAPMPSLLSDLLDQQPVVAARIPEQPIYQPPMRVTLPEANDPIGRETPVIVEVETPKSVQPVQVSHPVPHRSGKGAMPTVMVSFGRDADGEWLYAPLKHGIVANATGGGKTNTLDLLLGQLRFIGGIDLWYGTMKFVPIDPIDGLDRRPLVAGLPTKQLALDPDRILPWLQAAAAQTEARYKRMREEAGWFPAPMVVILDELKAFLKVYGDIQVGPKTTVEKAVKRYVGTMLTLGREAGISFVFTSQDGYCGSIALTKGEIQNLGFRLVHPEMDDRTKENLLPETALRIGVKSPYDWFCAIGQNAPLVTIPRVTQQMLEAFGLTNTQLDLSRGQPIPAEIRAHVASVEETITSAQCTPEQFVRQAAEALKIKLPVSTDQLDDKRVKILIKVAVNRGLRSLPIARIIFDAERNAGFQTRKLSPIVAELQVEPGRKTLQ